MASDSCPLCRKANGCELAAGSTSCWCFAEPPIAEVDDGQACLCQDCYRLTVTVSAPTDPQDPA